MTRSRHSGRRNRSQARRVRLAATLKGGERLEQRFALTAIPPAPTLGLLRDTGISSSDLVTNDARLSVSGLVEGANVEFQPAYSSEWSTFFDPIMPLITVSARQVVDGIPSAPSLPLSFEYDTEEPWVRITTSSSQLSPPNDSSVDVLFSMSEEVFGFTAEDVVVTGGTLSDFGQAGMNYTAIFTAAPNFSGWGTISIGGNGFTDAAGNGPMYDGLTLSITDASPPEVAITSSLSVLSEGETALIRFTLSEPSADFDLADVSFTGGTLSDFSGSSVDYSAIFTPTPNFNGVGSVSVAAAAFTDMAGNLNVNADGDVAVVINIDTVVPPPNGSPTAVTLTANSVVENSPVGTVVGTLSTIDPDAGDTFTYALVAGTGDTDNSFFQIVGDQLRTNAVFNHDTKSLYSIRLQSSDAAGFSTAEIVAIAVNPLANAVGVHVIDARASVSFAGVPVMSFAGPEFAQRGTLPLADLSVVGTRPIPLNVTGLTSITVSASGQWAFQGGGETGPAGGTEIRDTSFAYPKFGISGLNNAPLNMLAGVFVDDTLFNERGLPPTAITYVGQPVTSPALFQTFPLGAFSDEILVPPGATRLYLGMHDAYEWSNNTGTVSVAISPGHNTASPESDFVFENGVITDYTGAGGDVVIPATIGGQAVTAIGERAFENQKSLTGITLPYGITSIGFGAFSNCQNLTRVNLPESLTSIDDGAFQSCLSLASISIPASVTSVGGSVFSSCTSLASITVPLASQSFKSVDGVLYDKAGARLIAYPTGRQGAFTVLPTVTSIGVYAFGGCTGLSSVSLPAGLTSIENGAFSDCTGLASITVPAGVTNLGKWAFYGCTGLTTAILPPTLTAISESAFFYCISLPSITLPDGLATIGISAFFGCRSLTSLSVPSSVTAIGHSAFGGCEKLEDIAVSPVSASFKSVDGVLYDKMGLRLICCPTAKKGSVAVLETVSDIDPFAFYQCRGLSNITLPGRLATVGQAAFIGCVGLTSIALPSSVTSIGNHAFSGCTSLASITLPPSLTSIGYGAFADCTGLTTLTLPAGLTTIGNSAFRGCTGLTSIVLPAGLRVIDNSAFAGCTALTDIVLPDGLTNIENGAFSGCIGLTNISIPGSLSSVGEFAFRGCTGLTTVSISEGVVSIGQFAFEGCTGLTSIALPASVATIGDSAFRGCVGLISLSLQVGLTAIGDSAFRDCTGLTSITLPSGLTTIGDSAFEGCTGLTSAVLSANLSGIGRFVFRSCTNLTSVTLQEGLANVGHGAFMGCTSIEHITIPGSITVIDTAAFFGCTGLTSIAFPAGLTAIGDMAFEGCIGLTSITLPAGLTTIGSSAFSDCTGLRSIDLSEGVASIGLYAFHGCTGLTSINLPDSLATIGQAAFAYCAGLTSIIIPSGVTIIDGATFYGCTGLTHVTLPENLLLISWSAFSECTGLTEIVIPSSTRWLNWLAFEGCSNLKSLYFAGNAPRYAGVGDGFVGVASDAMIYHVVGTAGWTDTFGGLKTALLAPPSTTDRLVGDPITYAGNPISAAFQSWTIFEAAVIRGENILFAQHATGRVHRLYANADWSLVGGLHGVGSAYSIELPRSARGPNVPTITEPEPLPADLLIPVAHSGVALRIDSLGRLYADQMLLTESHIARPGITLFASPGYSPIAIKRESPDSMWSGAILWQHRIDRSLIEWRLIELPEDAGWGYQGDSRTPTEGTNSLELAYQIDINHDGVIG